MTGEDQWRSHQCRSWAQEHKRTRGPGEGGWAGRGSEAGLPAPSSECAPAGPMSTPTAAPTPHPQWGTWRAGTAPPQNCKTYQTHSEPNSSSMQTTTDPHVCVAIPKDAVQYNTWTISNVPPQRTNTWLHIPVMARCTSHGLIKSFWTPYPPDHKKPSPTGRNLRPCHIVTTPSPFVEKPEPAPPIR